MIASEHVSSASWKPTNFTKNGFQFSQKIDKKEQKTEKTESNDKLINAGKTFCVQKKKFCGICRLKVKLLGHMETIVHFDKVTVNQLTFKR